MNKNLTHVGRAALLAVMPLSFATPALAADWVSPLSSQDSLLAGLMAFLALELVVRFVRRNRDVVIKPDAAQPRIVPADLRSWKNPLPV